MEIVALGRPYPKSPQARRDAEELAVASNHYALQRECAMATGVDQLRRSLHTQGWAPTRQRAGEGKPQARSSPANQRAVDGITGSPNGKSGYVATPCLV